MHGNWKRDSPPDPYVRPPRLTPWEPPWIPLLSPYPRNLDRGSSTPPSGLPIPVPDSTPQGKGIPGLGEKSPGGPTWKDT
eukprot:14458621-Heterocapsa_arctica.AAC.1